MLRVDTVEGYTAVRARAGRLGYLLSGAVLVVLAGGPRMAEAQPAAENTPEACSDRLDNDGDGYVDCYDPDCNAACGQTLEPTTSAASGAPASGPATGGSSGAPAPTSPYAPSPMSPYAPSPYGQPAYCVPPAYCPAPGAYPPPVYYAPPMRMVQPLVGPLHPPRGVGEVIAGSIFLPLGVLFVAASIPLWNACGDYGCSSTRDSDYGLAVGATVLDLFGAAFLISGLAMVISGAVKEGRYNRWKAAQPQALLNRVTPLVAVHPRSGDSSIGLRLSF